MLRTHTCGELRPADVGRAVTLAGWVHRRRDHGGLLFVDIRDRHGLTQVLFDPEDQKAVFEEAQRLGQEWVVAIDGRVAERLEANPDLVTGAIEVRATAIRVLNRAEVPPFEVSRELNLDEAQRLRYRYLDLRRERMAKNLRLRHQATTFAREFLARESFMEVETPILGRATPEGARDYLVPSRVHPGQFYALPQSPQQTKQILMVAGFDRYYQFARCFRDEDLRADRQPEFTQLDVEMSFVDAEDVMATNERLMIEMASAIAPERPIRHAPFPRLEYVEALSRFGSDKPDMRFGLELIDLSATVAESDFRVFRSTVESGGRVKALCAPAGFTRREIDDLETLAKERGAAGLAWLAFEDEGEGGTRGPIAKFLSEHELTRIRELCEVDSVRATSQSGVATVLIVAAAVEVANAALSRLRLTLGEKLNLIAPDELSCCWVVNAPLVAWDADQERWDAVHHPFTAPHPDDQDLLEDDPASIRSLSYDLVCNGFEIAGGSIRINDAMLQARAFALIGVTPEQAEEEFGHMLEAFSYGAPPHGGIAWGWDRTVMLLAGETTIREVIAFPKTLQATDPMTGAPAPATEESLATLNIAVRVVSGGSPPPTTTTQPVGNSTDISTDIRSDA